MASKASGQVTVVDITDAYSVLLTSESYTFVGNTTGAPSGLSCTTQVVAYCGAQQCSKVSVSTVTCPTGISATITNNDTVSPTITFKTTATITAACEATIPVVVDGVTINKKFSFAVAKQGTQGNTGATGKGISSVTPQYYISTSKTSATGGSWSDTAPTTVAKGKYLWTRMKVIYTNPSSTEYTTATYDSMTDSRIEQLKDSITLEITGSDGVKTSIAMDDEGKIALTGDVMAQRINVEELMAKHLTSTGGLDVTGDFSISNAYGKISQIGNNNFFIGSNTFDTGIEFTDTSMNINYNIGPYNDEIKIGNGEMAFNTQVAEFTSVLSVKGPFYPYGGIPEMLQMSGGSYVATHMEGIPGKYGYVKVMEININNTYSNTPITFGVIQRSRAPYTVTICFNASNNTDPSLNYIHVDDANVNVYMVRTGTSRWEVYILKAESWDSISITELHYDKEYWGNSVMSIDGGTLYTTLPSDAVKATVVPSTTILKYDNGYYGMITQNGGTSDWIRTTSRGIIPYSSGGASSLGASDWPFTSMYTNSLYVNGNQMTDYVVAQGWSGDWWYRKWASGRAECWGYQYKTITIPYAYNSGVCYGSDQFGSIAYPFTMSYTRLFVTPVCSANSVWLGSGTYAGNGINSPSYRVFHAQAVNSSVGVGMYIYVSGFWN